METPPTDKAAGKSPDALRTISEVSRQLGVAQHVLRFWETRFPELQPMKRRGNRRYYRPGDIELAAAIHSLLHDHGYTVKGVQKLIAEHGVRQLSQMAGSQNPLAAGEGETEPAPAPSAPTQPAATTDAELRRLRGILADALAPDRRN